MADVTVSGLYLLNCIIIFQIDKLLIGLIPVFQHHFQPFSRLHTVKIRFRLTGLHQCFPLLPDHIVNLFYGSGLVSTFPGSIPIILCLVFGHLRRLQIFRLRVAVTVGFGILIFLLIGVGKISVFIGCRLTAYLKPCPGRRSGLHLFQGQKSACLPFLKRLQDPEHSSFQFLPCLRTVFFYIKIIVGFKCLTVTVNSHIRHLGNIQLRAVCVRAECQMHIDLCVKWPGRDHSLDLASISLGNVQVQGCGIFRKACQIGRQIRRYRHSLSRISAVGKSHNSVRYRLAPSGAVAFKSPVKSGQLGNRRDIYRGCPHTVFQNHLLRLSGSF